MAMIEVFVFDTNSLISAYLLPNSVSRKAFDRAREIGITVYSDETLTEFVETFIRPKFDKYISIERRLNAIAFYEKSGQHIHVSMSIDVCRDKKDNKFLELAIESGATCLITGDQDLLVLNPLNDLPIITAPEFLKLFS